MWKRFQSMLRCPECSEPLKLTAIAEHCVELAPEHSALADELGMLDADFTRYIETGLLFCGACAVGYPIIHGLPILLPYTTNLHDEFERRFRSELQQSHPGLRFADREPVPGERFVLSSFSTEWLAYDFDGVIWEMGYADHERRFLLEVAHLRPERKGAVFLELGCGIGLTTQMAQRNFGVDAVGVDLSLASLRATQRHRTNPFLHFVQGSVFYLPFAKESFDTIYSRGVLHHTYSTAKAFSSLASFCRRGGATYLWVYGPRSIDDNLLRRGLFVAEREVRRLLQGRDSGWLAKLLLPMLAGAYMVFNWGRRLGDRTIQPYNFRRALHAARDRFTPEFAHRHDHEEVSQWFKAAEFVDIEVVDWRVMPSADHDDYRRNTGVRGRKALPDAKLSGITAAMPDTVEHSAS
jgi:ubiquinone/menaquinone biosynthesis C-methylase UbiE/uncharacterized protein YbaR (Trm112 family)